MGCNETFQLGLPSVNYIDLVCFGLVCNCETALFGCATQLKTFLKNDLKLVNLTSDPRNYGTGEYLHESMDVVLTKAIQMVKTVTLFLL